MKVTVVLLSIPPKNHLLVPPYPISCSATIGPVFFKDVQLPNAPLTRNSLETKTSILAAVAILSSLVSGSKSKIFLYVYLKTSC